MGVFMVQNIIMSLDTLDLNIQDCVSKADDVVLDKLPKIGLPRLRRHPAMRRPQRRPLALDPHEPS